MPAKDDARLRGGEWSADKHPRDEKGRFSATIEQVKSALVHRIKNAGFAKPGEINFERHGVVRRAVRRAWEHMSPSAMAHDLFQGSEDPVTQIYARLAGDESLFDQLALAVVSLAGQGDSDAQAAMDGIEAEAMQMAEVTTEQGPRKKAKATCPNCKTVSVAEGMDACPNCGNPLGVPMAEIASRPDVTKADKAGAVSEYGDVTFADAKNKKYPIDSEEHVRAAWNYINKGKNAAKYDSGEVDTIKQRIVAAWKKIIGGDGPPSAVAMAEDTMKKTACKECKKLTMTSDATKCPECGYQMAEKKKAVKADAEAGEDPAEESTETPEEEEAEAGDESDETPLKKRQMAMAEPKKGKLAVPPVTPDTAEPAAAPEPDDEDTEVEDPGEPPPTATAPAQEDVTVSAGDLRDAGKNKRPLVTMTELPSWMTRKEAIRMDEAFPIEVMATGEWAGRKWTTADLDQMAENFAKLDGKIMPPLKLGHEDKQVLAQKDGQPALGWVTGLKRVGDRLVATVANIPEVLRESIRAGRYRRVSPEIYPKWHLTSWERNLKSGVQGHVLSAVSLLGADIPEVKELSDLAKLLSECGPAGQAGEITFMSEQPPDTIRLDIPCGRQSTPVVYPPITRDKTEPARARLSEDDMADTEKLDTLSAQMVTMQKTIDELNAKNVQLTENATKWRDAEASAKKLALREQAKRFVTERSSKENFKLFPTQRELAVRLYEALSEGDELITATEATELHLLREGETPKAMSPREAFMRLVDSWPSAATLLSEEKAKYVEPRYDDFDSALSRVIAREKLNGSDPSDRAKAARIVASERPDLLIDYRSTAAN